MSAVLVIWSVEGEDPSSIVGANEENFVHRGTLAVL
jgi:hypothetical protein